MDQLRLLKAFQTVASLGSFALAARRLDVSASQMTRDLKSLEQAVGARLLNRSTRKVALTAAGQEYLERISPALSALDDAARLARESTGQTSGRLRISAPMSLGTSYLGPAVAAFLAQHPNISVDIALNDQFEDIAQSGVDLALRVASEPSPDQISRIVAYASLGLFASKAYLARFGWPEHPRDIALDHCYFYSNAPGARWRLRDDLTVPPAPASLLSSRVSANNGELLANLAASSHGVVFGPYFAMGSAVQRGDLQAILQDFWPNPIAVYAVMPSHRLQPARVTAFCDFLVQFWGHAQGQQPPWENMALAKGA